jgi:predicted ATP-grasp superfamily ATP-dependent carboligase
MPQLESEAKKFLEAVDFNGVCGLDFRYDLHKNKIAYIETNARFTGGLATPVVAGFDIPWVIYKLATEGKYDEAINVKIGVKTKWILGDIITLIGRILKLKWNTQELKRLFSFKGFDAFDDFCQDDKTAILGEFRYYFEKLIKNGKLNP